MYPVPRRAALLGGLLFIAACGDRFSPAEPDQHTAPNPAIPPGPIAEQHVNERLAHRLALALAEPEFRGALFQALQQSRIREGKIHFQKFLEANRQQRLRRLAELSGERESVVVADLEQATALEVYLPVPAHRKIWRGGVGFLVATAEGDHDVPVAFDSKGTRQLLDPDRPPATPVIALERAEVDFDAPGGPQGIEAYDEDPNGGGNTGNVSSTPGLYLTYAKINSSFEGWLKGNPEFEIHILGQDGTSDAMRSYQCAGESAGAPYEYNQDEEEWHGTVMLFSQAQLDAYKAQHPGQAVRILVLEDDDTRCVIKTDSARVAKLFSQIVSSYGSLTGGKDTLISIKTFKKATTLISILKAFWSAIQTKDDVVGTAIEDSVVREYYSGANWIIKGENTITQGALKLEMR